MNLPAESWICARDGIGGAWRRACGAAGAIAYLGASVTAQRDGYRRRLHERLVARTGHSHRAINAGVGGTGTVGLSFLVDELVLCHRPDICILELVTGDAGLESHMPRVGQAAEGLVRKLLAIGCAPILVHAFRGEPEVRDRHRRAIREWEKVADHYGIPSLHACRVIESDSPSCASELFPDGVHSSEAGAEFLSAVIERGIVGAAEREGSRTTPPALWPDHFGRTKLLPIDPSMARLPHLCTSGAYHLVKQWVGVRIGNSLQTHVVGDVVGMLVVAGPHSGAVSVETDRGSERVQVFDQWSHYDRLATVIFTVGGPLRHVRVAPTDDDVDYTYVRRPVAPRDAGSRELRAVAWLVREDSNSDPSDPREAQS